MSKSTVIARLLALTLAASAPTITASGEVHHDQKATPVSHDKSVFKADPSYESVPYNAERQLEIYGGKHRVTTPRPMLEWGQEIYQNGPLKAPGHGWGEKNPTKNQLAVYGDWRTAVAYNDNGGSEIASVATRLNIDIDYQITSTERIHAFVRPIDGGGKFSRCEFGGADRDDCKAELDGNLEALFFEGDLGAITAGITGKYNKLDLPFAVGLMPLLFQNGVWVEDAFTGFAFTLPALNSPKFNISNMDITFFAAFDKVTTAAIRDNNGDLADHNVNLYGVTTFIDAMNGYWELGYGYVDGEGSFDELSYHNITAAFTRRYGGWLSNSIRVVGNFGQNRRAGAKQTADGFVVLIENSLISSKPSTLVPYFNLFAGFDTPQSLARDAGAGGILKNTGINFETDALTGFPKLDDSANNTWGGALGIEYLFNLDRQIVVEIAALQTRKDAANRLAAGDQWGLGVRFQQPLNKAWIFRADSIIADRENAENLFGVRFELRRKF